MRKIDAALEAEFKAAVARLMEQFEGRSIVVMVTVPQPEDTRVLGVVKIDKESPDSAVFCNEFARVGTEIMAEALFLAAMASESGTSEGSKEPIQ